MTEPAVLHVLPALGGGVDRYVRDIVATVARAQLLYHVGDTAEVLEAAVTPRFQPLDPARVDADPERLAAWLRGHGVGVVHLHGMARRPRERAALFARLLGIPLVVTLHDVLFLRPDAFAFHDPAPEPQWVREIEPVLRAASAVLAPSGFIAGLARDTFPGLEVDVVPNGLDTSVRPSQAGVRAEYGERERAKHVVAVLGAIGTHKGADVLRELPPHLEGSGIGIVVIGYLDEQLFPGWNTPAHAFVHGPYEQHDTAALLRAYDAALVLFPNHAPESFSYTLSEAWAAGFPVLASARGAIGERVRAHGGGFLLPENFGAADVAREVRRLVPGAADGELARVKSQLASPDAARVPTLPAMASSIEAYYRRYGQGREPASPPDLGAIQPLLATSLDSALFRQELAHLADLCDDTAGVFQRARRFEGEARAWIAKLEGDVAALQAESARIWTERQEFAAELERIRNADSLGARLPKFVQRVLMKLFGHARS